MTAGTGKQYIGHAIENDRAGDMTLIGPDIPHLHLCDSLTGKSMKGVRHSDPELTRAIPK